MQRILIGLTLLSILALGVVAAQPKAPNTRCTWKGTPERDVKTGSAKADVLCSLGGSDFIHGADGNDRLRAGPGRDVLVGAGGRDILRGSRGNDRLFAVDGQGGEVLRGGRGADTCFADRADRVVGCERTFRGLTQTEVHALERMAFQVMQVAELALPSLTATLPPPVITITQTIVIVGPDCSGHPAPPPIC